MYQKAQEKLTKISEKIENDFTILPPPISSLSTQIAHFSSLLVRNELLFCSQDNIENTRLRKIYKEYKAKLKIYKEKLSEINSKAQEVNNNTYESVHPNIAENESVEDEFITSNARRVLTYSHMALDSLDSLRKQRQVIESARGKIKNGLIGLGVSNNMVEMISNRYLTDYYFFMAGVAIIILLLIFIKYCM
ncbi:hypothetical protein COBT_000279 [Conglomerata obtusa]